jgi:selenide,water dikinase
LLIHDPQTSGGLLLAVASEYADEILTALQKKFAKAALIGEVLPSQAKAVILE